MQRSWCGLQRSAPLACRPPAARGRLGCSGSGSLQNPVMGSRSRYVGLRVAYTDRAGGADPSYNNHSFAAALHADDTGVLVGSIEDQLGLVREQGRVLATEMMALKAEAERKVAGLAAALGSRNTEPYQVARLQAELESARREVDVLQSEAAASAALRDELAARTAALAATRDQLLQLEAQRSEELEASMARYAELEEALAVAEQSVEYIVDEEATRLLEARVASLEAELADASSTASSLSYQLRQAQQARDAAEQAEHSAKALAQRLQAEAHALARQLAEEKGEFAYAAQELAGEESGQLVAEFEVAQREAATLAATVLDMRAQIESLKISAARGGREAALHRARAAKLQAQLAQHQVKADSAAQRAQQLEAALQGAVQQRKGAGGGIGGLGFVVPSTLGQNEAMMKAQQRLHQLEEGVMKAMTECDAATSALTDALHDQHAAEQAQRAVEEALSMQVAKVASLEAALSEQATHAEAAAQRERMLESQLGAQIARADDMAQRAQQLEGELAQQAKQALAASHKALALERQLGEVDGRAGSAEAHAGRLRQAIAAERSRAEGALQRAQAAESQLAALARREVEVQAGTRAALAAKEELRALLEAEKARSGQLEGEVVSLRREYERADGELQALTMQAQRAQHRADRSMMELDAAKHELATVQTQLASANAELEALRAADQIKSAKLAEVSKNAEVLKAEVVRLTDQLAGKDAALQHWKREAELATQLAQEAVRTQARALTMVEKLQVQLTQKEQERQGLRANALALREQFLASQAETRALREELAAARAKMESAERMSADLQDHTQTEVARLKQIVEATEAAAKKTAEQFITLLKEKEALTLTALARADGRVVVRQERQEASGVSPAGSTLSAQDFISEEEVEGLLDELDLTRCELEAALKVSEEAAARAEAAEAQAQALQCQVDDAASRAQQAEQHAAALQSKVDQLAAAVEEAQQAAGGDAAGVGRRMRGLMQELTAAKAAARAAEETSLKLAAEKTALLKELAFGSQLAGATNGAHVPLFANSIKPWRLSAKS
ncbi:hypothetical protein N2152v2_000847 [Parachlorella kessleri]